MAPAAGGNHLAGGHAGRHDPVAAREIGGGDRAGHGEACEQPEEGDPESRAAYEHEFMIAAAGRAACVKKRLGIRRPPIRDAPRYTVGLNSRGGNDARQADLTMADASEPTGTPPITAAAWPRHRQWRKSAGVAAKSGELGGD